MVDGDAELVLERGDMCRNNLPFLSSIKDLVRDTPGDNGTSFTRVVRNMLPPDDVKDNQQCKQSRSPPAGQTILRSAANPVALHVPHAMETLYPFLRQRTAAASQPHTSWLWPGPLLRLL